MKKYTAISIIALFCFSSFASISFANPFTVEPINAKVQIKTPINTSKPTQTQKINIPKNFEKEFNKGIKRSEILVQKNNLLKTPVDIEETRSCIENTSLEKFASFGETPKDAFKNWMKHCRFTSTSALITRQQNVEKKKEYEKKYTSFKNINIPQEVINSILDTKKWDATTKTLLGNQQEIYHSLESLNNEALNILEIHELIGVGISSFSGSTESRKKNFINAAEKLNGKIIHPGESLSMVKTLSPFTNANGYTEGLIIKDGETETEMGGGVCQTVTTMFRSWNNAGLEITKFKPHSKSIAYYGGIGLDATMYQGPNYASSVDLLLKNNSNTSVLIKTVHSGNYQIFLLYGTKDRKVTLKRTKFESSASKQKAIWERTIEYFSGEVNNNTFIENQTK